MKVERHEGYAIVRSSSEISTKQGLPYFLGLSGETVGAKGICMHIVIIPPGSAAEPHSHSEYETAIYMLKGRVDCRFGQQLEETATIDEGNLLYIGPNVMHQPINRSPDQPAVAIVARNDPNEQEHVIRHHTETLLGTARDHSR